MSNVKYHINSLGEIKECRASSKPCPLQNYDTIQEAEQALKEESVNKALSRNSKSRKVREGEKLYGGKFVSEYKIPLTTEVEAVLNDLQDIGNPLIVGGYVRDQILDLSNKDIDIEVHSTDIESLAKHLRKKGYKVDEVGKQFGVLKASKNNVTPGKNITDLDISVPRRENKTGAGHRSFSVEMDKNMTVSEAADRRDFTINGIMYDHKRGLLIDPANGKSDLENKTLRHISQKFAEDPLRVMRGFQFAARFKMTLAPETAELAKSLRSSYDTLSIERTKEEWGKFYHKGKDYALGIKALQNSGWDDTVPGLRDALKDENNINDLTRLSKVSSPNKDILATSIITRNMTEEQQSEMLKTSLISKNDQNSVRILTNITTDSIDSSYKRKYCADKVLKHRTNFKTIKEYAEVTNNKRLLEFAEAAINEGVGEKAEAPIVSGADLIKEFKLKPSAMFTNYLDHFKEEQYKGTFSNHDEAMEYVKRYLVDNNI